MSSLTVSSHHLVMNLGSQLDINRGGYWTLLMWLHHESVARGDSY